MFFRVIKATVSDMHKTNNEQLIAWTKSFMILGGFWDEPITVNHILEKVFHIYSIFMRYITFLNWFLLFCELIRLVANNYEHSIIFTNFGIIINTSRMLVKIVIFMKIKVNEVLRDVVEKETEIWESNDEYVKKLYQGKIRICKWYAICLLASTTLTVLLLQVSGAIGIANLIEYNKIHNTTLEPHFLYQVIIPVNKLEHLYWFGLMQISCCWVGIIYNCITYMIFVTTLVYSASQLEILQYRLRSYVESEFNESANIEAIEEKVITLKGLIKRHKFIIGFVQNFNDYVKYIILMEYILSSFDLAAVSTNLIKGESNIAFLVPFFILLDVQLYLLGWTSNEIKVQSEAISVALYEGKWYLLNKEAKQLTHIMMMRAQKSLVMGIGPFGPMTTTSMLLVFKAAYSYVSIMKK